MIVGSRGSALALTQSRWVLLRLQQAAVPVRGEIEIIQTTADQHQEKSLADIGGKGLFVKELEEALAKKQIDVAVHSLKDVPGIVPDAFSIAVYCGMEIRGDVLLSQKAKTIEALPKGAVVGTASPRRKAQLLALRPDLKVQPLRGNVETRIRKMESGEIDAVMLAAAGLQRLGKTSLIPSVLDPKKFLPAVGQGILGLEVRCADIELMECLNRIFADPITTAIATAERALLAGLGGDCHSPIAAHAFVNGQKVSLIAWVGAADGSKELRRDGEDVLENASNVGFKLAKEILAAGGKELLEKACGSC